MQCSKGLELLGTFYPQVVKAEKPRCQRSQGPGSGNNPTKKMPLADTLHRRVWDRGLHWRQQLVAGDPCSAKPGDALSWNFFGVI